MIAKLLELSSIQNRRLCQKIKVSIRLITQKSLKAISNRDHAQNHFILQRIKIKFVFHQIYKL